MPRQRPPREVSDPEEDPFPHGELQRLVALPAAWYLRGRKAPQTLAERFGGGLGGRDAGHHRAISPQAVWASVRLRARAPPEPTAATGAVASSMGGEEMPTPDSKHFITGNQMFPPWPAGMEEAMFGMGCFWCSENLFMKLPGVFSTQVGYAGGTAPNPTYRQVCSGATGHNEVVRVVFDPSKVSYLELLKVFWETHDPTQKNRQGNDMGTQYRSSVGASQVLGMGLLETVERGNNGLRLQVTTLRWRFPRTAESGETPCDQQHSSPVGAGARGPRSADLRRFSSQHIF